MQNGFGPLELGVWTGGSNSFALLDARYNHKQNDALGYFMWVRILSCSKHGRLVSTHWVQGWRTEARTQLAWHKKLPFNGEHLKLMGQAGPSFFAFARGSAL